LTSPEASENYRKPVHQMVADFEQNTKVQSTPEKNEVNTSQGVTHFKRSKYSCQKHNFHSYLCPQSYIPLQ
ncbi:hypothetical protein chiPu_0026220, partial [Chiloscyllium punctatum]|nr:hypothetical protein [Chiloscyllium punctatum]